MTAFSMCLRLGLLAGLPAFPVSTLTVSSLSVPSSWWQLGRSEPKRSKEAGAQESWEGQQ